MSKIDKLIAKIISGNYKNIKFAELQKLVKILGFELDRISGSHHIYTHTQISDIINLQDVNGEAKPYQIKQVVKIIEKYNLEL